MLVKKIIKDTDGKAVILIALVIAALVGFAAVLTDTGMVRLQRTNMRNAAEAAALAAAMELPSAVDAVNMAVSYAGINGLKTTENGVKKDGDTVTVTYPYNGNIDRIEVICTRTVQYSFARFIGFKDIDVSARAVAQKKSQTDGSTSLVE